MVRRAQSSVEIDGHTIRLTNPDKVIYPATGTTKADVIAYYRAVAPWFVAHSAGRPATRKRWVDGVGTASAPGTSFFTKNLDSGTPDWVPTVTLTHRHRQAAYPIVDDEATLVWLGQLAALEIHVPQWRVGPRGGHRNPDRLVLDLDPGDGAGLPECVAVALLCKEILDGMSLASVPVTSGSKGIHLYAGLDGRTTSAQATEVARALARALEAEHRDLVLSEMTRAKRPGKVFIDWSQNAASKTTVAPYSLRGRAQPFVAAPRRWDEMTADIEHLSFTAVLERLRTAGDPMEVLLDPAQSGVAIPEPAGDEEAHRDRLTTYRSMRDGAKTPEPVPDSPPEPPTVGESGTPEATRTPDGELPRISPMLATLGTAEDLSAGGWAYETKWDGYRAVASVSGGRATFRSRNDNDVTRAYPELQELAEILAGHTAILDGEIVALDARGRSSFGNLQNRGDAKAGVLSHYMIFDVLHLDGRSLLRMPYHERRAMLESLGIAGRHVHVPVTFGTDQELALRTSRELKLEGVIAKTVEGIYQPGARARTWVKIKNLLAQEVVIVGWTPGAGRRTGRVGSLLLAVHGPDGLEYAGKVGTGFTEKSLGEIGTRLARIERTTPPLDGVPRAHAKTAHWVTPKLVGEVAFTEWTGTGRLRHPTWRGWRPDKDPEQVIRADG